jgi:hypothetical protein
MKASSSTRLQNESHLKTAPWSLKKGEVKKNGRMTLITQADHAGKNSQ